MADRDEDLFAALGFRVLRFDENGAHDVTGEFVKKPDRDAGEFLGMICRLWAKVREDRPEMERALAAYLAMPEGTCPFSHEILKGSFQALFDWDAALFKVWDDAARGNLETCEHCEEQRQNFLYGVAEGEGNGTAH